MAEKYVLTQSCLINIQHTANNMRTPIRPGKILDDDPRALHMSANQLATQRKVSANRITHVLNGRHGGHHPTSGTVLWHHPRYWMHLRMIYELA